MTVNYETGEIVEFDWPHHDAADLFPMMDAEALSELAEDIKRNGLIEPVWLYEDPERGRVLLDGRNRLAACRQVGVEPMTQTYRGDDPVGFSLSLNCNRRHLTTAQKARAAYAALPLFEAEAARRRQRAGREFGRGKPVANVPQANGEGGRAPLARDLAAKRTGISGRTLAEYKRVAEKAPDLLPQVDSEEMSLRQACKVIREREGNETPKPVAPKPPPPPRFGGNRKKHLAVLDSTLNTLSGITGVLEGIDELDASVTSEEAARIRGDLSKQISALKKINDLLKERTK